MKTEKGYKMSIVTTKIAEHFLFILLFNHRFIRKIHGGDAIFILDINKERVHSFNKYRN